MEEVSSHVPEPFKSFETVSNQLNFAGLPAQAGSSGHFAWVSDDPHMARDVLAKTEEELIHGLSALMRNKVEQERAQRALAVLLRQVEDARRELVGIKNQIRVANDELSTRMAEHTRMFDEISRQSEALHTERIRQLEQQEAVMQAKAETKTVFQQLAQARAELAERHEEVDRLTLTQKTLREEVLQLTQERDGLAAQLAPLRGELDERILAREGLIQQILALEKHLQQLGEEKQQLAAHTPTLRNQLLFWEEQVSLLNEKANDLKSEHEQRSADMQRIETEKSRLVQERDRVGAELSSYEQKLNQLRFSYAEVQERLEEARLALMSTEQEHDEAVARLITAREEHAALERSLELARTPPFDQPSTESLSREPPKVLAVDVPKTAPIEVEPEEEFPTQAYDLPQSSVSPPAERAVEAPSEALQPLEVWTELPGISPNWDSYVLESEFFTEEELDAQKVIQHVGRLPGLTGAMILPENGRALALDLPAELHSYFSTRDRDYGKLFASWPNQVNSVSVGSSQLVTNRLGDRFVTVVPGKDLYLVVSHTPENLRRGVLAKLTTIANELSEMYPADELKSAGRPAVGV